VKNLADKKMDLKEIELWSFDKLVDSVAALSSENGDFGKNLGDEMSSFLKATHFDDAADHEKASRAWLSWCGQQKSRVKVQSPVLKQILSAVACKAQP
jgi:hypothetical protein